MRDVIDNIKMDGSYYQKKTLVITLGEKEKLFEKFKEAGYIDL